MADETTDRSWVDRLDGLANSFVNRFFDYKIADTQAEAEARLREAEDERQTMIDQLSRQFSLGTNAAGQYVANLPAWVLPAAVLGFGGVLLYKYAR